MYTLFSKHNFRSVFILPFEGFNFSVIDISSSPPPPFTRAWNCHRHVCCQRCGSQSIKTRKEDCRCREADDGVTLGAECAKEKLLRLRD